MPMYAHLIGLLRYTCTQYTQQRFVPDQKILFSACSSVFTHRWVHTVGSQRTEISAQTSRTSCAIHNLSGGRKGCIKALVMRKDVNCVIWLCKSLFRRRHSSMIKAPSRWKWWMLRTSVKLSTFTTFPDTLCLPWCCCLLSSSFCKLDSFRGGARFVCVDNFELNILHLTIHFVRVFVMIDACRIE